MHKCIQWIFKSLINIVSFLRLLCVFFIIFLSLYWIQNTVGATWQWMGFISPILDGILDFVNSIYSFSFDFWGKTIEIKYFNAFLLLLIVIFILKAVIIGLEMLSGLYEHTHNIYKKTTETVFNRNLQNAVKSEEKKNNTFKLYMQIKVAKKYDNQINHINIDDLKKQITKFINDSTNTVPEEKWNGYVYTFNDFERVDYILEILFKIMSSSTPADYAICIQIGEDETKLRRIAALEVWNKIIMTADTLYRYTCNDSKRYQTKNVGIFRKNEENTSKKDVIEVHEFVENL